MAVAGTLLYEGKAKKVFATTCANEYVVQFKDALTALNGQKTGSFAHKGAVNRDIASLLFQQLKKQKIESHWLADIEQDKMRVLALAIVPLEVVVRNVLAGSTAKKLGIAEGKKLDSALVEFYYKKDELNDPFISDDQILMMGIATSAEIQILKEKARQINQILIQIFAKIGIELIDFKIEFGKDQSGKLILADEITPDCCRLWDKKSNEKLDKDRFRRDLGGIAEAYQDVLQRLKGEWS